ncbi:MAG TPA: coenzyme F420-0:L-glutamate ligase [Actinomycetota bacterium]|nr:coenzyme F420-0:L-glutamate ligase [Actinomycetota bacterium]
MTLEVLPVSGLPEIRPGDDLADLIVAAVGADGLGDGDVVAVAQKAVSKAEGRLVPEGEGKVAWVAREASRIVARRGDLVIAETRHGFVCANAGIDVSNVPRGSLSLLPEDPDASAARIAAGISERTGRKVGVVVTDTFGRPWRRGLVDVAIGCAGLPALLDLRGEPDREGRLLESTVMAIADQAAAAAGIVMAKAGGVPVAVVRGLPRPSDAPAGAARDLVRPATEDLFRSAPLYAISSRRTVRAFRDEAVPDDAVERAVAAALTAPVPHGSRHRAPPWRWTILRRGERRRRLLAAMADAWRRDLRADGFPEERIERRIERSDAILAAAPTLAIPAVSLEGADAYPDARRREAERDMFLLATGAAVQSFMLALHAQGVGSSWISSTLFCKEEAATALGLDAGWLPMGAVAAGFPAEPPPERPPVDPSPAITWL